MAPLEAFLISRFIVFTLVLARISGMIVIAPLFGTLTMPKQVRAFLAVAMALLVTPVYLNTSLPPVDGIWPSYAHLLASEVAVGLLLGLGRHDHVLRHPGRRADRQPNERHVAGRRVRSEFRRERLGVHPTCSTS